MDAIDARALAARIAASGASVLSTAHYALRMSAPPVPMCYRHPGRETYVRCVRCERPICPDCMREAPVGFQCPECVAQGRRTQRAPRTAFGGSLVGSAGYATMTLVGLNVLMALVGVAMVGLEALVGQGLFSGLTRFQMVFGQFGPSMEIGERFVPTGTTVGEVFTGIDDGAVYRLLTATFTHFGILHLLLNMYALWMLGRTMEAALGPLRFLALYLLSGLGGGVAAYLFSPDSVTAGASGAVFGVFAALFVVLKRLRRDTSSVVPAIVINLVITFAVPGISIAGHLGGLVTGALLAAGLAYAPRQGRTAVQIATFTGVAVILAMLTGVAMLT
jgi:membrane associated rhomboid family serine protease